MNGTNIRYYDLFNEVHTFLQLIQKQERLIFA